jgi:hypothetical protein
MTLSEADPERPESLGIATVRLDSVLKGVAGRMIRIVYRGEISEGDPLCCAVGGRYFMMLAHSDGDLYTSVDGPYGIFDIDPPGARPDEKISWPGDHPKKP